MIYTIKTTSGREDIVVDILHTNSKSAGLGIKALIHPAELKGYVFVEGNLADIHKAMQGMLHIRGIKEEGVKLTDLQKFLEVKKISVDVGDEVEIVAGGFKGDKGLVNRIDKTNNQVTVELLEGSIPIPITIPTEFIKIIKKARKTEEGVA